MAVVIAGLFVTWIFGVEYYPVSSWYLYAGTSVKKPVFYYRMVATLENGRSVAIPVRDYSPAVMPASFVILARAFHEFRRSSNFEQFLSNYVERRNRNLAFGSRILTIEIQQWKWNYAVDPHDPHLGWINHRYVYDAVTGRSSVIR